MRTLGIIPARAGSKGVPQKNIRVVGGYPLIYYSIWAARLSHLLSYFVVSTDDEKIAAIAEKYNAKVIMRPPELATDECPLVPVIQHSLKNIEKQTKEEFKYIVVLQPTSPLRTSEDIDNSIDLLRKKRADSVISVYQVTDNHPARMYKIVRKRLVPYEKEPHERLRQSLPKVYHRNGAIYACRRSLIKEWGILIGARPCPYVMPKVRSINIDDELDLIIADVLIQKLNEKNTSDS